MDRGTWQATFQGVTKSQRWLKRLSIHSIHPCVLFSRRSSRHFPFSSSVQFSRSVVSDSLPPHEPQHARPPCPSPTPGVYSNPCPLSWWCHPAISSSVIPFSSCRQSFPASGSFQMSQLFASGSQSIGVSASASVLPMNIQDWFPLGWTGWISLQSNGFSRVFSSTRVQSISSSVLSFLYSPTLTSIWKVVAEWLDAGFLASGGDEFNPGPETRLDRSELLCN